MLRLGDRPGSSSVMRSDPLDYAEPDSGTAELFFSMKALERNKELVCIFHIKANAIVPDTIRSPFLVV
jgi:hypothetical protein